MRRTTGQVDGRQWHETALSEMRVRSSSSSSSRKKESACVVAYPVVLVEKWAEPHSLSQASGGGFQILTCFFSLKNKGLLPLFNYMYIHTNKTQ